MRPLPYAEAGYGYPEAGQTVVNVTNGKIMRLLVDDEPFDVRYGELRAHERVLDLRAGRPAAPGRVGLAGRHAGPRSPRRGWSRSPSASVAAILYEVEPLDDAGPGRRAVGAGRQRAHRRRPRRTRAPRPRSRRRSSPRILGHDERRVVLVHRTRASGLRMAAAMDHVVDAPGRHRRARRRARRTSAASTIAADARSPASACGS